MRRDAMLRLVGSQICGAELDDWHLCLLAPDHDGEHSSRWPKQPLSPEQKLERRLAKLKEERDRRTRQRESLKQRIRDLERRRRWVEGYLGFRIEYRIRGGFRRLRRYRRIVWNRTYRRWRGQWPPC